MITPFEESSDELFKESSNELYSTRDQLLINNIKIPALELYQAKNAGLKSSYIEWLKKEPLGKYVCYMDLTFEVPTKGRTTLSIVARHESYEIYTKILEDFITNDNTLYPHIIFQRGIPSKKEGRDREIITTDFELEMSDYSESFLVHEIKENNSKINSNEKIEFTPEDILLDKIYYKAEQKAKIEGRNYFEIINNKSINDHWLEWKNLHITIADNGKLLKSNAGGFLRWILVIPLGIISDKNKYTNIGSIFLGMDSNCEKDDIIYFTRSLVLLLLSSSQRYYEKVALNNSIKSAIAAIMARNMSHNLGSHFLTNTKNYFSNLSELEDNADLRGVKHVLQYVQERMDFVATVVSADIFPYGPVNIKSQIFDELKVDDAGKRHNKPTTNFLLDFLVSSEHVSKNSRTMFKNEGWSDTKLDIKIIFNCSDKLITYWGSSSIGDEENKLKIANVNYAIPGGILGRHAIFNIVENIIRNSAKHDSINIPQEGGLVISLKLESDRIIVFDNKNNAYSKVKIWSSGNDTTPQEISLIDYLKIQLLDVKILKYNGEIDKKNKGLKEMLISALWLKNENIPNWFSDFESKPEDRVKKLNDVFGIVAIDDEGNEVNSNYRELDSLNKANLGYYFKIDHFEIKKNIASVENLTYEHIKSVKADIIACSKDIKIESKKLSQIYPRFIVDNNELNTDPASLFKKVIRSNTSFDPEKIRISIVHPNFGNENSKFTYKKLNKSGGDIRGLSNLKKSDETLIVYKNHFGKKQVTKGKNLLQSTDQKEKIKSDSFNEYEKLERIDDIINFYQTATYLDAISGENFTSTIVNPEFLNDEINRLKVIESALTGIAIIDERIFNNFGGRITKQGINKDIFPSNRDGGISEFENCKNIIKDYLLLKGNSLGNVKGLLLDTREKLINVNSALSKITLDGLPDKIEDLDEFMTKIDLLLKKQTDPNNLNANEQQKILNMQGLFIYNIEIIDNEAKLFDLSGNNLSSIDKKHAQLKFSENTIKPLFLAIHLSLIEKIAKQTNIEKSENIMKIIEDIFPDVKFITIHSGRGNLSEELEIALKDYAFMSLSAIEAALYNSKFFLAQLFYNTNYYGKGNINN